MRCVLWKLLFNSVLEVCIIVVHICPKMCSVMVFANSAAPTATIPSRNYSIFNICNILVEDHTPPSLKKVDNVDNFPIRHLWVVVFHANSSTTKQHHILWLVIISIISMNKFAETNKYKELSACFAANITYFKKWKFRLSFYSGWFLENWFKHSQNMKRLISFDTYNVIN